MCTSTMAVVLLATLGAFLPPCVPTMMPALAPASASGAVVSLATSKTLSPTRSSLLLRVAPMIISLWQLRLGLLCSVLLLLLLLRAHSLRLSILDPPPLLILLILLGLLGLAPRLCLLGRAPPHLRLYG